MKNKLIQACLAAVFGGYLCWGLLASEVAVEVPDEVPLVLSIRGGVAVESFELVQFNDQQVDLIARSGSGAGRTVRLTVRDGRLSVLILGATDVEPDPPGPVDPVNPPGVPDGHLGFTKAVYEWVTETVDPAADPDKVEHAHQQAANYVSVAAGLVSVPPAWSSVADAFAVLKQKNQDVLGDGPVYDAWAVAGARIGNKIEELWPFSMAEGAAILQAIADGLKAVK